jgi:mercuric ion binding protein
MTLIAKIIILALLPVTSVFAASQSTVLDVQNMTCSMCSITVKKALQKVPGLEAAKIDYDARTATVKHDLSKASIASLVKATTDAGFPFTPCK